MIYDLHLGLFSFHSEMLMTYQCCRVLLWRRSDNVVFSLVLEGSPLVNLGDGVECNVTGILQVADETEGPKTKREYEATLVPVGDQLVGKIVNYMGRPLLHDGSLDARSSSPLGTDAYLPLINEPPSMENREPIDSGLFTGVKSLDIITPLGKGQALQVSGVQGSGKSQLCIDTIMGQKGAGVRCVYAAVGCAPDQLEATVNKLRMGGCMSYTTVVAATSDRSLGEQFAAISMACSIAERVRNEGQDSLVVLNDVGAMVKLWEAITVGMATLGSVAVEIMKDDLSEVGENDEGELVEYEGMLVSVAAAQRRRFFSNLIQRCARLHKRLLGGSMTGLFVVPGSPASGVKPHVKDKISKYKHLTPAQKEKLLHALEQNDPSMGEIASPHDLRTEVVEEFMSMTDGQIVLKGARDEASGGVLIDPQLSVSRIGARAYAPAIAELASLIRFELAQATDAQKYAANSATDPLTRKALKRAAVVTAALPQEEGSSCPLEHQVIQLMAVQQGLFDEIPPQFVASLLKKVTGEVASLCPRALAEIAETKKLSNSSKAAILAALMTSCEDILKQR